MRKYILITTVFFSFTATAQRTLKCAGDHLLSGIKKAHPSFVSTKNINAGSTGSLRTQSETVVIPVIFHIVLDKEQIAELGGREAIRRRVLSQLSVMNRDFNAENSELSWVPGNFRETIGTTLIRFALAQRNMDGFATEGFQIQQTRKPGFYIDGTEGSGLAFSNAKYFMTDGDQAWDPTSYLNIWVINPLSDNGDNILGLTIPPSYVNANIGIPQKEQGIVIHYKAFGLAEDNDNAYLPDARGGRTLVHELGHYFGLRHIWGDDYGLCENDGGNDDGISDTPPQSDATTYCAVFPLYDNCSYEGDGVMFMNFMDYTPDPCAVMFTQEQAHNIYSSILPGGDSYSLTQHPQLLDKPSERSQASSFSVWPNPASDHINIYFEQVPYDLRGISIFNTLGQQVSSLDGYNAQAYYSLDTRGLAPGVYFIRCNFEKSHTTSPLVIQ